MLHQPLRIPVRCVALVGVLASSAVAAVPPLPAFADYYQEDHPSLPSFDSGTFASITSGAGFAIFANSQANGGGGGTYPIPTLARFDDAGDQTFGVFMDTGGGAFDQELTIVGDDPAKFFAGFLADSGDALMGLYEGATLTTDYALSTPLVVTRDNAGLHFFPGEIAGLVQDRGTSVRVLTVDALGQRIFEEDYSSSDLLGTEVPGFATQTTRLEQVPDQSGFFLSVHWSQLDITNPLDLSYTNRFLLLRLDNAGSVEWSRSFDLVTSSPIQDFSTPTSNNSYLYYLPETSIDLGGGSAETSTNIIKIAADGSLAFSRRIDDLRITSVVPTQGGQDLYLGGLLSNPAIPGSSEFVILRLAASTGVVQAELAINQGPFQTGSLAGVTSNHVYALVLSSTQPGFGNPTIELVRLDRALGDALTAQWTENASFASLTVRGDNELVFSPFDEAENAVGAFSLDGSFSPLATGCTSLSVTSLNGSDPGLNVSDLPLTLDQPTFTTTSSTSALDAASLPVSALDFQVQTCGVTIGRLDVAVTLTAGNQIKLAFPTQVGFEYEIDYSPDLSVPFQPVGSVAGTGNTECFQEDLQPSGRGFYRVSEILLAP